MQRNTIPCPDCLGEGGHVCDDEQPIRTISDWKLGETYHSNWAECETCGGSGEIEDEELEP